MSDEAPIADGGAVDQAQRAWQSARAGHGAQHEVTLTALLALAGARQLTGDLPGALRDATDVLEGRREILGHEHPDTVAVAWLVSSWRHVLGEAGAADELTALIPVMTRVLGADHRDTLWARHIVAGAEDTGDPGARLLRWVQLCGAETRVFGTRHHLTLSAAYGVALARHALGDPFGASTDALVVYRYRRRLLGELHPETLAARLSQVTWRGEAMGVDTATLDDLDEVVGAMESALGHDHPNTLLARYTVAVWTPESTGNAIERISEWEVLPEELARGRGSQDSLTVDALDKRTAARRKWQELLELTRDIAYDMEFEEASAHPDLSDDEAVQEATEAADEEEAEQAELLETVVAVKKALSACARTAGNDAHQTLLWRYYLAWCLWSAHEFESAHRRAGRLIQDSSRILGEDHPLTGATQKLLSYITDQTWAGLAPFWEGDVAGA